MEPVAPAGGDARHARLGWSAACQDPCQGIPAPCLLAISGTPVRPAVVACHQVPKHVTLPLMGRLTASQAGHTPSGAQALRSWLAGREPAGAGQLCGHCGRRRRRDPLARQPGSRRAAGEDRHHPKGGHRRVQPHRQAGHHHARCGHHGRCAALHAVRCFGPVSPVARALKQANLGAGMPPRELPSNFEALSPAT